MPAMISSTEYTLTAIGSREKCDPKTIKNKENSRFPR
jgi:hypothetical protein